MLTLDQLKVLASLVKEEVIRKGASFYAWQNPPVLENRQLTHTTIAADKRITTNIDTQQALAIYQAKLDGVYGERCVLSVCTAIAAAKNGKQVALLQIAEEPGLPFDATGWLVLAIEGHPIFHLSPTDLPLEKAHAAGLVILVAEGSPEAKEYAWKGTTKVDELGNLLDWVI